MGKTVIKTVDEYLNSLSGWQVDVCTKLVKVIKEAAPKSEMMYKWDHPVSSAS